MKNLTIMRLTPFKKPDTILTPNRFRALYTSLKYIQQTSFTIENIIKTNFMIL